jgi:hypothetical protein
VTKANRAGRSAGEGSGDRYAEAKWTEAIAQLSTGMSLTAGVVIVTKSQSKHWACKTSNSDSDKQGSSNARHLPHKPVDVYHLFGVTNIRLDFPSGVQVFQRPQRGLVKLPQ